MTLSTWYHDVARPFVLALLGQDGGTLSFEWDHNHGTLAHSDHTVLDKNGDDVTSDGDPFVPKTTGHDEFIKHQHETAFFDRLEAIAHEMAMRYPESHTITVTFTKIADQLDTLIDVQEQGKTHQCPLI